MPVRFGMARLHENYCCAVFTPWEEFSESR